MRKIYVFACAFVAVALGVPGCGGGEETKYWTCEGTPPPCSSRSDAVCALGAGCTLGGSCSGTAMGCGSFANISDCEGQRGCTWNLDDIQHQFCAGTPTSCSSESLEILCGAQLGCDWRPACTGTSVGKCNVLIEKQCKQLKGCSWTQKEA